MEDVAVVLTLLFTVLLTSDARAENKWIHLNNTQYEYYIPKERVTRIAAMKICENESSYLVQMNSINFNELHDFIVSILPKDSSAYYIGLEKRVGVTWWIWTRSNERAWPDWPKQYPLPVVRLEVWLCGYVSSTGEWLYEECNSTNTQPVVICQRRKQAISTCSEQPCLNHGICIVKERTQEAACLCQPGTTGRICELSVNYCDAQICGLHGRCVPEFGEHQCLCEAGYTGKYCEVLVQVAPRHTRGGCCEELNPYYSELIELLGCVVLNCTWCTLDLSHCNESTTGLPLYQAAEVSRDAIYQESEGGARPSNDTNSSCMVHGCLNRGVCAYNPPNRTFYCVCERDFTGSTCESQIYVQRRQLFQIKQCPSIFCFSIILLCSLIVVLLITCILCHWRHCNSDTQHTQGSNEADTNNHNTANPQNQDYLTINSAYGKITPNGHLYDEITDDFCLINNTDDGQQHLQVKNISSIYLTIR